MNAVWKSDLPSTRKFVALSLADQANDMGECYPSIPMIAERCSLSDRAVRGAIRELEQAHVIRSEMRTAAPRLVTREVPPKTQPRVLPPVTQ